MARPVYFKPERVAELLEVDTDTLKRWRAKGIGPKAVKLHDARNAPVRYPEDEFNRWRDRLKAAS